MSLSNSKWPLKKKKENCNCYCYLIRNCLLKKKCDIVQADHAPDGGVAQGVIHGILIRHHGRNQEEVEEGTWQEVKGQEEENAQTTKCTCMDGMR